MAQKPKAATAVDPTVQQFDALPIIEQNYQKDAAELEPQLLNSAAATSARLNAMTPEEIAQSRQFWEYQRSSPLTPRSRQAVEDMLGKLSTAGRPRASLSDSDVAMIDQMVDGPYQG